MCISEATTKLPCTMGPLGRRTQVPVPAMVLSVLKHGLGLVGLGQVGRRARRRRGWAGSSSGSGSGSLGRRQGALWRGCGRGLGLAVNMEPDACGSEARGPTAGGDPRWNTDCTFASRFFQTTVFTANKPKFFPAGVAFLREGRGRTPGSLGPSPGTCLGQAQALG